MTPESWSAWAAWLGLLGGSLSGIGAWKAYKLAKRHEELLRGDEEIVAGRLQKPDLTCHDHRKCVLWTDLVNRSPRRAVIDDVLVFGPRGEQIDVTWSGTMSDIGNIEGPTGVLAVESRTPIFIRRTRGEEFVEGTVVKLSHSFPGSPLVLKYRGVQWSE